MYGSQAVSNDLNLPFPASTFKLGRDESDLHLSHEHHHQHPSQMSSGLLRYRSAPSAVLGDVCEEFLPQRSSGPDAAAESMFARYMAPGHIGEKGPPPPPVSQPSGDAATVRGGGGGGGGFPSSAPQVPFHSTPHLPGLTSDGTFRVMSSASAGMNQDPSKSPAVNGVAHLIRHGSSPPGMFSTMNVENGFPLSRGTGGFRPSGGSSNAETAGSTPSKLKSQISFSSRQGSGLSQISEIGSDNMGGSSPEDGMGNDTGAATRYYIPGYPVASWEESAFLSENFSSLKRNRDPSDAQNGDMRNHHVSALTHHFSLPKTSAEMAAMERFLQFQDAVPCKIRAKRGCATHPRSIAERVRRTRISERMRKLQELVPNMDKQTNTADMLDLAVEYIKDLQRQAKTLSESRDNCTCSGKQKP